MCHEVSCCSRLSVVQHEEKQPFGRSSHHVVILLFTRTQIGHGFGLPHTDENFNNQNTGECMDYTRNPSQNKQPGPENFAFLQLSEFHVQPVISASSR